MRKSGKPGLPPGAFRIDVDKLLQGQGNRAGAGLSLVDKTQPLLTGHAKRTLWEAVDTTTTTGRGRTGTAPATPSFAAVPTPRQRALRFQKALTTPARKQAPAQKPQTGRKIQPRRAAVEASQFSSAARPEAFRPRWRPDNSPAAQRARLAFAHGEDVSEVHEMVKQARLAKKGVPEQNFSIEDWDALMAPEPPVVFSAPMWDKNYQIAQDALFQFNGNIPRDTPEVAAAKKAEREHWSNNLGTSLYQVYDGAMTTSNALDLDLAGDHLGAAFLLHNADKSDPATFGRGFSDNVVPSAGGVAGAGMGASALGTFGTFVGGPVGGVVGGIAGGFAGGYLGDAGVRRLQDEALKSTLSQEAYQSLLQLRQEDQTQRAAAYGGGQLASQLVWMQPKSLGELGEDGSFLSRVLRPGGMAAEKAALGNTAFVGAMGRLAGDGINVALPVGQELLSAYQEGRPVNSGPLFVNAGLTLFAKNNRAGDALYNGGRIVGTGAATTVLRGAHTVARSQPAIALRNDLAQRPFFTQNGWNRYAREMGSQLNSTFFLTGPSLRRAPGSNGRGRDVLQGAGLTQDWMGQQPLLSSALFDGHPFLDGAEVASYNTSGTDPITTKARSYEVSQPLDAARENRIGTIGTVGNKAELERVIEILRNEGRPLQPWKTGNGNEILAFYASNGNLLRARQGTPMRARISVHPTNDMSPEEWKAAKEDWDEGQLIMKQAQRGTMLHNHPMGWSKPWHDVQRQGNSFSLTDIKTAINNEIFNSILVTPGWTFKMAPLVDGRWDNFHYETEVAPAIERITRALVKENHLPQHADFDHRVMLELAKDGKLYYSYKPSNVPWWYVGRRYSGSRQ